MIIRDDIPLIKNILNLHNKNIDTHFLYDVLTVTNEYPDLADGLLDSFSTNQANAKLALLNAVDELCILNEESTVVIWGAWYGSILIPYLADKVKKVVAIDLDPIPLQIAKNRLFPKHKNVDYITDDIFNECRKVYMTTDLIINTSCEHMKPMKAWPWFGRSGMNSNCWFAFQSNNMFGIQGHVNCVKDMNEFKSQLPVNSRVYFEEEVEDTRGTRYMLVGKL